ncbi:Uncharacterized protein DAT39_017164 [Clarias magur]|uniref:Uncharacterized protein n=1 Tax=Clarias magur TaxID=1594786 RepID=A0A8J4TLV6_CLAMG|nr:Uncharacterized protein DAT39_017164 [Clarias magur]
MAPDSVLCDAELWCTIFLDLSSRRRRPKNATGATTVNPLTFKRTITVSTTCLQSIPNRLLDGLTCTRDHRPPVWMDPNEALPEPQLRLSRTAIKNACIPVFISPQLGR